MGKSIVTVFDIDSIGHAVAAGSIRVGLPDSHSLHIARGYFAERCRDCDGESDALVKEFSGSLARLLREER